METQKETNKIFEYITDNFYFDDLYSKNLNDKFELSDIENGRTSYVLKFNSFLLGRKDDLTFYFEDYLKNTKYYNEIENESNFFLSKKDERKIIKSSLEKLNILKKQPEDVLILYKSDNQNSFVIEKEDVTKDVLEDYKKNLEQAKEKTKNEAEEEEGM